MPDISDDISETEETEGIAKSPAKSRKKLFVIILVILLATGGGGGFYIYRSRVATAKAKEKNDKTIADADKNAKGESGNSKKLLEMSLPDDGDVKQVVELQPFIVNLADESEPRYLRMTVSVGLAETGESKPDPLFTTKVRSAMLAILTSKRSEEVLTAEGKATLRRELLRAAQAAVAEPQVHAVYITDFIVQL